MARKVSGKAYVADDEKMQEKMIKKEHMKSKKAEGLAQALKKAKSSKKSKALGVKGQKKLAPLC